MIFSLISYAHKVETVGPPLHHLDPLVPKLRPRIGAADGVALDMGELRFDCVRVP